MESSESGPARGDRQPHGSASSTHRQNAEATVERAASNGLHCSTCGADVPDGARSCPVCRRGVFRTCYCGRRLPADEATCPDCGADWSQSTRVARRSKSRKPRTREVVRSAAIGALVAIVAALVIHVVLSGLAGLAVNDQQAVPVEFTERLKLALDGIGGLIGRAGAFLWAHAGTIALAVGIAVVGAASGAAWQMLKQGSRSRDRKRNSRRKRRKRR